MAIGIPAAIQIGSMALGALKGNQKQDAAEQLNQRRLQIADERYQAGAPFRSRLAQLALKPTAQREDLSGLVRDPGNPYARVAPRVGLAQQAFAQQNPMPRSPAAGNSPAFVESSIYNKLRSGGMRDADAMRTAKVLAAEYAKKQAGGL